jgi:arginyl-tRNA synthetase
MSITAQLRDITANAIADLYQQPVVARDILINATKPEFEGDYTVVLFPFVKSLRTSPDALGQAIGQHLQQQHPQLISGFNVIKGFLNLSISNHYWISFLHHQYNNPAYGRKPKTGRKVMVEYSSPNTNKPLHLGHLRNNFLGWSAAAMLDAVGCDVIKCCIVNDRGVHICKSMYAWQQFANGATPQSTGTKGDHFVGEYYVQFENLLREQSGPMIEKVLQGNLEGYEGEDNTKLQKMLEALEKPETQQDKDKTDQLKADIKEIVRNYAPAMLEVKAMLRRWEAGDPDTIALWKMMNEWVYAGFDVTYKRIGSDFHKIYYESDTYLLGKDIVEEGLANGSFYRKEDQSVWVDLTADGLDHKLVLRKDGTSVYITQDLGLAQQKYEQYGYDDSYYVIADEQNYHMKALQLSLRKLGKPYANGIHHLSYGMVELPDGKMKSREGTVVDADDIVEEMKQTAEAKTKEQGKTEGISETVLQDLYEMIGLGGLKFFLLRVDPKKRIVFDPAESIDLHGFTATYVQYAHARIKSVLRKVGDYTPAPLDAAGALSALERALIIALESYEDVLEEASKEIAPSAIAQYVFNIAQAFNSFYNSNDHSIANAGSEEKKALRLAIATMTAHVIASAMALLGIRVPEQM